jgi:glycosyltransferase involved in cell wall biosynthesis
MKPVAFLLGNLTDGGSETKTVRMANRFAEAGHDVHLVYLGAPHTLRPQINDNVAVEFLDRRGKFSIRAYRKLKTYVRDNEIETVVCINHYPLIYGWPVCRFGGRSRRCIAAMNTYEFTELRDKFFMLIYGFILRRCDRVVFGSKAQQDLWLDKYRLPHEKSVVIYNGVDVEHFGAPDPASAQLGESLAIRPDTIVIGCVAHLRPEKAHSDLLAAARELAESAQHDFKVLLIGEGPEEARLREYASAYGLSDIVRFCGRASDVRPYLDLIDIFVLPSSSEVFSNAILEAMATGIPVVCTAVGGSVEMVVNGRTGFTYPRQDVTALAESLSALIADADLRDRLGRSGAERARAVFSIQRMDEQYADILAPISNETDHG